VAIRVVTDRQTHRTTTITLLAHVRRGLITLKLELGLGLGVARIAELFTFHAIRKRSNDGEEILIPDYSRVYSLLWLVLS
jgi:hypothetical protein